MANVTMDMAELDQYREKIKQLEIEKQDLLDKQQQVLFVHKHYDGKIVYSEGAKKRNLTINGMYLNEKHNLNSGYSFIDRHIVSPGYNYFNQMISFDELVNNDILKIDLTENTDKTNKEYKNLNEVISEIREEEKEKLITKLNEYSKRATEAEVAIETIAEDNEKELLRIEKKYKDQIKSMKENHKQIVDDFQVIHESEISDMQEVHKKEISDLKEAHYNEIETLKSMLKTVSEEFETFKGNKKQATLEEQITILTTELEKYKKEVEANKNKKLIDRIFKK
jgi:hypothetical protein